MAYCTQQDIEAEIGTANLAAMTDDSGAGIFDAGIFNNIVANASAAIDGRVSNIYSVPFSPVPPKVHSACIVFVCEKLYQRRLTPDEKNPYKQQGDDTREDFKRIGNGELELDLNFPRNYYQGAVTGQPTTFSGGSPFSGCGVGTTL